MLESDLRSDPNEKSDSEQVRYESHSYPETEFASTVEPSQLDESLIGTGGVTRSMCHPPQSFHNLLCKLLTTLCVASNCDPLIKKPEWAPWSQETFS